jgi:hypothetical protein
VHQERHLETARSQGAARRDETATRQADDPIVDYERWESQLPKLSRMYREAEPYPSIVLEDFLLPGVVQQVLSEFPDPASSTWNHYTHVNEIKLGQSKRELIPPRPGHVIDELTSPRLVRFLSELTGIPGLFADPSLEGGGLHQIKKGGFLNVHADFTAHPHKPNWARRVNLLLYLNPNWQESYGGQLELWDKEAKHCVRKILPVANRCVVFSTDPDSFHGHPLPLTCPDGSTRKSIALYYFTEHSTRPYTRSTEYRARPTDSTAKAILIYLDKMALRLFDFLKRRFGISNEWAGKILRLFSK